MNKYYIIILCFFINFYITSANDELICKQVYVHKLNDKIKDNYHIMWVDQNNNYLYIKNYDDGKSSAIYNGSEGKKYDKIDSIIELKSNNYAYIGAKDGKWVIVKNGVEINDTINVKLLTFSEDGNSFSYASEINGKWYIVKDGKIISKGYDWIFFIIYSDKNNVLYDGLSNENKNTTSEELGFSRVKPDMYINGIPLENFKGDDIFLHNNDMHLKSGYFKVIKGKLTKFKNEEYGSSFVNYNFIDSITPEIYSENKSKNSFFTFIGENTNFYQNDKFISEIFKNNAVLNIGYFSNNNDIFYNTAFYEKGKYISKLELLYINDKKIDEYKQIYNINKIGINKIEVLVRTVNNNIAKIQCDTTIFNYGDSNYIGDIEIYNKSEKIFSSLYNKIDIKSNGDISKNILLLKEINKKIKLIMKKNELYGYLYRMINSKIENLNL